MRLHVLDALTRGGREDRPNDDSYAVSPFAVAAIDGATGLGDAPLLPGASDASWLAVEAADCISGFTARHEIEPRALVRRTAEALQARFAARRIRAPQYHYEVPCAALAMLAVSGGALSVAWFGDCRALVRLMDGRLLHFGPKPQHREVERTRARSLGPLHKEGGGFHANTLDELRRVRALVNTPRGYGMLAPDPACAERLHVEAPVAGAAIALVMSDGFYALAGDYERYDDAALLKAAESKGLEALYAELRAIEDEDPDGRKFPRFKKSDDATAVLARAGD